jgi:hypothetical protein
MSAMPDLSRAADFIWRSARLLDRHRFAYLFLDGPREAVVSALRAYHNDDGGFGNALEPDLRAPVSQPVPTWSAFQVLDEVGGFDDPIAERACDYLMTVTKDDGGVPFVLPSSRLYPRAPWWETEDDPPGSLLPTAGIAAVLHKNRVEHPWVRRATEFCWGSIDALQATSAYDMRFVFPFLQHVPDRARAEAAFARVGPMIFEQDLVELDPEAPGEVHTPLDFAPRPDSIARSLFTDDVMRRHLDALAANQQPDGGWMFNWREWNVATTQEWRASVTIEALLTLRAFGVLG